MFPRATLSRIFIAIVLVGLVTACGDDGGGEDEAIDAAIPVDADPLCTGLDNIGGVPNCSICTDIGRGCDTISVNGSTSMVCDCQGGGCPCGLRCGDLEIAPGVTVGNICIR